MTVYVVGILGENAYRRAMVGFDLFTMKFPVSMMFVASYACLL
jgi:hypothetical protein